LNRGNTSFFCHSLTAVFLHFLIGENLQNHIGVDKKHNENYWRKRAEMRLESEAKDNASSTE